MDPSTLQLHCDNLYTEIPLLVALKARNTFYIGTARPQKSFLPKPIMVKSQADVSNTFTVPQRNTSSVADYNFIQVLLSYVLLAIKRGPTTCNKCDAQYASPLTE